MFLSHFLILKNITIENISIFLLISHVSKKNLLNLFHRRIPVFFSFILLLYAFRDNNYFIIHQITKLQLNKWGAEFYPQKIV